MATIFEDNFNSYIDGNLKDQGSWTVSITPQVQGVTVFEGAKAVKTVMAANHDSSSNKIGSAAQIGRITFYFYTTSVVYDNTGLKILDAAAVKIYSGMFGNRYYLYKIVGDIVTFLPGTFNANEWNYVQIEWDGSTGEVRGRLNENDWSNWVDMQAAGTPDRISINWYSPGGAHDCYFDYIAEEPYLASSIKTINGLAKASCKTFNGLAMSSVKNINGLS